MIVHVLEERQKLPRQAPKTTLKFGRSNGIGIRVIAKNNIGCALEQFPLKILVNGKNPSPEHEQFVLERIGLEAGQLGSNRLLVGLTFHVDAVIRLDKIR